MAKAIPLFGTENGMGTQYLTISEAAALKGVSPSRIHEAMCSGELPTVMVFRSDLLDHRLIQPWELEVWSRGVAGPAPRNH